MKRCGNGMGRRFGDVNWPEGMAVWVSEAITARAGAEEPRSQMRMTVGDRMGPRGLGSRGSYR